MRMFRTADGSPKWWLSAVLIVALMPVLTGCYGNFKATRGLYKWNDDATNSAIVEQLLFWGLVIIPVYQVATLADIIVLNTIEFWSGADKTASRTLTGEDGTEYALAPNGDGQSMTVTITRPDQAPEQLTYTRVGDDRVEVADAQGNVLRTVTR